MTEPFASGLWEAGSRGNSFGYDWAFAFPPTDLPSSLSFINPHMKQASSLATAATHLFLATPLSRSRLYFLISRSVALSQ